MGYDTLGGLRGRSCAGACVVLLLWKYHSREEQVEAYLIEGHDAALSGNSVLG